MKKLWIILMLLSVVSADNISYEQRLNILIESAKNGNGESLNEVLDELFFRANSLTKANPKQALEIYKTAKQVNPKIEIYLHEERMLEAMSMCSESQGFDAVDFMKQYNIDQKLFDNEYAIWELAEEVSKDGKFGKANPKLVFDLVCRGGFVPVEVISAVQTTYKNWKKNDLREFNLCEHITSGIGGAFCANRDMKESQNVLQGKKSEIKIEVSLKKYFDDAYKHAFMYIDKKTEHEEGHGGTSRYASVIWSQIKQKNDYLDQMKKIQDGFKPYCKYPMVKNDQILNQTYKQLMKYLQNREEEYPEQVMLEDVKIVQRTWIPYRDSSAKLFSILNPSVSENEWKSYLTQIRIEELKALMQ